MLINDVCSTNMIGFNISYIPIDERYWLDEEVSKKKNVFKIFLT